MGYSESLRCISLPVAADYSAKQYHVMNVNSSGQAVLVAAKGAAATLVLQDKPDTAGYVGSLGFDGVTKVVAGAVVAAGAEVISDATARVIATDAAEQYVLGTALEAATAAGDIISVLINKYQTYVPV
ncbi:MAG: DUF2190 family protein [Alphaproteobacteria bacterium]|nr:DUF2190 family protein [Alphaproteobacteria bacterium]